MKATETKFLQKLTLLILFFTALISGAYSQVVNIAVSPNQVSQTVTGGSAVMETLTISNSGNAPLTWSIGDITLANPVTFSKEDFTDWQLAENQDRITGSVWLTRKNSANIFNIAQESGWNSSQSPLGTEWAEGKTSEVDPMDYGTLDDANGSCGSCVEGLTYSMHIPAENRYFDIEFTSFSGGGGSGSGGGGGFSYTRTEIIQWITPSLTTNTVAAGGSENITLTIDATSLSDGVYNVNVVLNSNAGNNPSMIIPVEVTVTGGTPDISVPTSVAFTDQLVGNTITTSLAISNPGTSELTISNIESSEAAFTPSATSITVPAQGVALVDLSFSPTLVQAYAGTLTLTSDAASSPTTVNLSGSGLSAPTIGTVQTSFTENLTFGNTSSSTLTVNNTGAADLNWTAEVIIQGSEVSLAKERFADWTLPENQDALTPTVTITRADKRGLFNILQESGFDTGPEDSPKGTMWASGKTVDLTVMDYETWVNAHGYFPGDMVGNTYSMVTTAENRYFDFKFTEWGSGDGSGNAKGGNFAYTRAEVPNWLRLSTYSGVTSAAGTSDITLNFDANTPGGTYIAEVVLRSDDPQQPVLRIPATITITGTPTINIPVASVDLGDSFIGEPTTTQVEIQNTGSDDLTISSIVSDNVLFTVTPTDGVVKGMQSLFIDVTFTPTTAGVENGQLTVTSDDGSNPSLTIDVMGNGLEFPNINVSHSPFTVDLDGGVFNETITIENTQGANLDWTIIGNDAPSLADALTNLNANADALIAEVPGGFNFDIFIPFFISDGGYNNGNQLGSEVGGFITYSDNVVFDQSFQFGMGTNTFTRHLDGLFVMATELNGVNEFRIDGSLDAPASATVDGLIIETTKNGVTYQGFVKRVYNTESVPAVHHMVIIEKDASVTHTFDMDPSSDKHTIIGLANTKKLYHLAFSRTDGGSYGENRLKKIINGFLDAIAGVPEFVTLSATSGSTASGANDPITVTIDPADVTPGVSSFDLFVESNDPDEPSVTVPFAITGNPKAVLSATTHSFGLVNQGIPVTQEFILQNTGISTLEVTSIVSDEAQFAVTPTSAILASGEQSIISVTYDPTVDGAAAGVITLTTNDPVNPTIMIVVDGSAQTPPVIVTTPTDFRVELFPGETFNGQITIENTQGLDLNWDISMKNTTSLEDALTNLNANFADVTSVIPTRYDFTYDLENNGSYDLGIATGGMSMYANGNRLSTNFSAGSINYSDNAITDGVLSEGTADFGTNGRYFTRHLSGLFVLAADIDVDPNSTFNLLVNGALGGMTGSVTGTTILETTHNGRTYQGYVLRTHSGTTPSVNQLFIVEKDETNTYGTSYDLSSSVDRFQLYDNGSGFGGSNRIYYLMYSTSDASFIDNNQTTAIMEAFLQAVVEPIPNYMTLSAQSGTTAAGVTETITMDIVANDVTFEQAVVDMVISSNDPESPEVIIPLDIQVRNLLERNPVADIVVNEGFGSQVIDISNVFEDADGDALTYLPASGNENAVTVAEAMGSLTITEVGTGTSTVSIAADDGNGNQVFSDFSFRVNAVPVVASAITDQSYTIGFNSATVDISSVFTDTDAMDALSYSAATDVSGIVDVSIDGSTLTLTQQARGTVNVTVTADDGSGGQTSDTFEVFVDGLDQTITFGSLSAATYGDANFDPAATSSSSLAVTYSSSDSDVATITGSTVTIVGAGTATITASQAGDGTYNAAVDVSHDLVVSKVTLNVSTNDQTINEGAALPTFAVNYTGFVNGDDVAVLDTAPTASVSITDSSVPGTYTITISGGADNSYDFSYQSGTLTIDDVLGLLDEKTIMVYPNPVINYLSFSDNRVSSIEVFDLGGKLVLRKSIKGKADLTNLDNGSYMIHLRDNSNNVIYSGRIIKN